MLCIENDLSTYLCTMKDNEYTESIGKYRWFDGTTRSPKGRTLGFVLLHPRQNHADDWACDRLARSLGFKNNVIVYLNPTIAFHPSALETLASETANENKLNVLNRLFTTSAVICAWGDAELPSHPEYYDTLLLLKERFPLKCLGLNESGNPTHVRAVAKNFELQPFELQL